jgi:hypothetical protein
MQVLYVYGCSHVYGDGLRDRSRESFVSQLGSRLKILTANRGSCGASVKETSHRISAHSYFPGSVVLVLWPNFSRDCVIHKEHYEKISSTLHANKQFEFAYYRNYADYDFTYTRESYILRAQQHCVSQGIRILHMFVDKNCEVADFISTQLPVPRFDNFRLNYPFALDGAHMGAEGHAEYARIIADKISSFC